MNDDELITAVKERHRRAYACPRRSRSRAAAARCEPGAGFPAWPERWPWRPERLWP